MSRRHLFPPTGAASSVSRGPTRAIVVRRAPMCAPIRAGTPVVWTDRSMFVHAFCMFSRSRCYVLPHRGSGGGGNRGRGRCCINHRGTAFRFGGQTGPLVWWREVVHRIGDRSNGAGACSLPSAACPCIVPLLFRADRLRLLRRCLPRLRRLRLLRLLCLRRSSPGPHRRLDAGQPWSSTSRSSRRWWETPP